MIQIKTAKGVGQIISSLVIDAEMFRFINENRKKLINVAKDLHIDFATDINDQSYMSIVGKMCETTFDPIIEADAISDTHCKFLEKVKELMREEVHEDPDPTPDEVEGIEDILNFIKNIVGEIQGPAIIILKA